VKVTVAIVAFNSKLFPSGESKNKVIGILEGIREL